MKILSKLVTREIIPPMIVSLVIFLFVFLMRTIAELARNLIENQYSLSEIGWLLFYSIPPILGFVIPMSLLLGIILGLNRLSSDSEIISLLSSGISAHSLARPLLFIASIAWLANTFLLTEAVPWANTQYQRIVMEHTSEVINSEVQPRIFNENFPGFILFVNEIDSQSSDWKRMFMFDTRKPENPGAILAKEASLIQNESTGSIDLQIRDYHSYSFPRTEGESGRDPARVSRGTSTIFRLVEGESLEERVSGEKRDQAKTIPELLEDVRLNDNRMVFRTIVRNESSRTKKLTVTMQSGGLQPLEKTIDIPPTTQGDQTYEVHFRLQDQYEKLPLHLTVSLGGNQLIDTTATVDQFQERGAFYDVAQETQQHDKSLLINSKLIRVKVNSEWIEIHKKFALPFTCIIFALLGLPLGLSSRRGGKAYGYVVGIAIFIVYWALLSTGERLALYERLSPALGIWLPNIVMGLLALFLFFRRRVEVRLPGISRFLLRIRPQQQTVPPAASDASAQLDRKRPVQTASDNRSVRKPKLGKRFPGFISILDKYIIKTFLGVFSLVFLAIYSIFSLVQYIDRSNDIQKNDVDPSIIIDFFIYQAPETVYWIIPISTLMGTLICFGLLSKNHEVTAFKSSGVSVYRLSIPVVLMAILISMLSFYNQDIVIPITADDLAEVKNVMRGRAPQTIRDPSNRWILAEDRQSIYFFYQFDDDTNTFNEIHVYDIREDFGALKQKVYARQATWSGEEWLTGTSGWTTRYDGVDSTRTSLEAGTSLPIPEGPDYFDQELRPADQMSYAELEKYIENLEQYGLETTREEFQQHWKLAFPFLPLVMSLLGLPFAFTNVRRGGALSGIFISIFMVIVYWGIMTLFKALGETGYLPALLAAWSPNIVFLGIGVLLFFSVRS